MPENFQHILRVMNTNIAGEQNVIVAMTAIKGCGRRFSTVCLKKAEIDTRKRAGELVSIPVLYFQSLGYYSIRLFALNTHWTHHHLLQSEDDVRKVVTIMQNPRQYKIPDYMLNRQKDIRDGRYSQILANDLNTKIRGMLALCLLSILSIIPFNQSFPRQRILRPWRRFAYIVVFVITGVSESVVNTQRPLADTERLSAWGPARNK